MRFPLDALTGVRFWAALMVLLFHFAGPGVATHNYLINAAILRGSLGVDLFFVLSGYIIQHVYGETFAHCVRGCDYRKFLSFRVARMYPVHLFTLGLMFVLYFMAVHLFHKTPPDEASYRLPAIIHNLLMTHAWFGIGSPNIPAWSISAEWFMYLLYPLLALSLFRLNLWCEWLLAGASLLAVYALADLHPLLHILPEFTFGATLYQLDRRLAFTRRLSPWSGWAVLACIIALVNLHIDAQGAYVPLFGLLILALTPSTDRLGQWLSRPVCVHLGEMSYSLYMVHSFIWSVSKNLCRLLAPGLDIQDNMVVGSAIAASLLASWLVYRLIEIPGRRFIRHWAD